MKPLTNETTETTEPNQTLAQVRSAIKAARHTLGEEVIPPFLDDLGYKKSLEWGYEEWLYGQKKSQTGTYTARANDPFADSGTRASEMDHSPIPPTPLWYGMYPGAVTYIAGETGAGKSSMLYNVALHAAQGRALWGIPFQEDRPLNVWYIDPENEMQAAHKIKRICVGNPQGLIIDPAREVNLSSPAHQISFVNRIKRDRINLVIIDPLISLFSVQNEDDNAEAERQMGFLRAVARQTGVSIVVVHHTGKHDGNNKKFGRGASARLGAVDVGMVWSLTGGASSQNDDYQGEDASVERHGECRLQITKNRLGGLSSIYLRMVGNDRFERVIPSVAVREPEKKTKQALAEEEIQTLLMGGISLSRQEILDALAQKNILRFSVDAALSKLEKACIIVSEKTKSKNATFYRLVA